MYPGLKQTLSEYQDITEFLEEFREGEGKRFARNKVLFAEQVLPHMTLVELGAILDLKERAVEASARIASWNGLKANWNS